MATCWFSLGTQASRMEINSHHGIKGITDDALYILISGIRNLKFYIVLYRLTFNQSVVSGIGNQTAKVTGNFLAYLKLDSNQCSGE